MKKPAKPKRPLTKKQVSDLILIRTLRKKTQILTLDEVLEKLKDDEFYERALNKKVY